MFKLITYPAVMLAALLVMGHTKSPSANTAHSARATAPASTTDHFPSNAIHDAIKSTAANYYQLWQLGSAGLSETAFTYAMKGFDYLNKANLVAKKNIISIVDFSQPSTQKRLYIIDVISGRILFNTWVAHGRNSGNEYANQFSNSPESHQSSLGFYVTLGTYIGGNGYSLRIQGCEKGINDKALERSIVIHGADYVSNQFINSRGSLGRSYGCPAIPAGISREIIDIIKNGSCLFLYHPTKKYCSNSKILNSGV